MKKTEYNILKTALQKQGIETAKDGTIYIPSRYFKNYNIPAKNLKNCTYEEFIEDLRDFVETMEIDYLAVATWRHNNPKQHRLSLAIAEMENNRKKIKTFLKETETRRKENLP